MAKLNSKQRRNLPAKDFALGKGRYPIEDKAHARSALSRISAHGTEAEKAKVRKKVHAKYPSINVSGIKKAKGKSKTTRKRMSKA
jgi:hypothetical protein